VQDLEDWLCGIGYEPGQFSLDGKIIRFGKEKSQWLSAKQFEFTRARGTKTVVCATAGDWRTGEKHKFKTNARLAGQEREQVEQEMARQVAADRLERDRLQNEAAKESFEQFSSFKWRESTPYTIRKKIEVDKACRVNGSDLIIPLYDIDNKFWTYQKIDFEGQKRFFTGGRKRSCFFTLGVLDGGKNEIYICEGYATGYSLFKSTGKCVVIAIDAGNIKPVALDIRARFRDIKITFAADRDDSGVGEKCAREAAETVGGDVILPPESFGDFNDAGGQLTAVKAETFVDLGTPLPDLGGDSGDRPLATIENVEEILRRVGIRIKYNVIKKDEDILIPNESYNQDNKANVSLSFVESWAARFGMPTLKVAPFLTYLAEKNAFNPVASWVTMKEWDGVDRLGDFCATIETMGNPDLKDILVIRWLISAIAAAFSPNGVSAHGVLVLQGAQAMGKTSWFKKLAPTDMDVLKDGYILRPDNKDSVKGAISHWIVELGELEGTFKKSETAALKAFTTQDKDMIRLPFAKKDSAYARRTVFFASVNHAEFLNDSTGNRRFWVIECKSINYKHNIDMQQVWAQAYYLYKSGHPWVLQPEELAMLNEANADFETVDYVVELLNTKHNWDLDQKYWSWRTVTDVLQGIGIDHPTKGDLNRAGAEIRRLNGDKRSRSKGVKKLWVPPSILG